MAFINILLISTLALTSATALADGDAIREHNNQLYYACFDRLAMIDKELGYKNTKRNDLGITFISPHSANQKKTFYMHHFADPRTPRGDANENGQMAVIKKCTLTKPSSAPASAMASKLRYNDWRLLTGRGKRSLSGVHCAPLSHSQGNTVVKLAIEKAIKELPERIEAKRDSLSRAKYKEVKNASITFMADCHQSKNEDIQRAARRTTGTLRSAPKPRQDAY